MSSFQANVINPKTKQVETALFIDNYFGPRIYGVRFSDGRIYKESELPLIVPPGPVPTPT